MYDVQITSLNGTITSKVMSWTQVRRYLPGGKLYGTTMHMSARRIMEAACHYCGRAGQSLAPCCDRSEHAHQLACADVAGCRDYLIAGL